MRHCRFLLSGVAFMVLSGCTIHLGYTPKLYLSQYQSDNLDTEQTTTPTITVHADSQSPASSPTPVASTCVIAPKPPKKTIPEPFKLVSPEVVDVDQANAVLTHHVLELREFIEAERKQESEYHKKLREACNP